MPSAEGERLLRAVEARYASVDSYSDRGTVTTVFAGHPPGPGPDATFRTAFGRGSHFQLHYTRDDTQSAAEFRAECDVSWRDGRLAARCISQFALHGQLITTDHLGGDRQPTTLGRVLADCASLTDGTSVWIPRLLLPDEVGGRALTDLDDIGEVDHAGHGPGPAGCRLVSGAHGAVLLSLWIDGGTAAIRRIVRSRRASEDVTRIDYVEG